MENRRRFLIQLGVLTACGVGTGLVLNNSPVLVRQYQTEVHPEDYKPDDLPTIVDGQPALSEAPAFYSTTITNRKQVESQVDWDNLLPPEKAQPYRDVDFSTGFLSVVVGVFNSSAKFNLESLTVENGIVKHSLSVTEGSSDSPSFHYLLFKWKSYWPDKPSNSEVIITDAV